MDDLNFIKEAHANPNNKDKDFISKKNETTSNQELVNSLQSLDLDIKKSMNIEVPSNLANKILLNTKLKTNNKNKFFNLKKKITAFAASVSIISTLSYMHIINGSIENKMLSEMEHHPEFITTNYNLELSVLNNQLKENGFQFSENIGKIRMISNCNVKGESGIHFVINGNTSPIIVHYFKNLDTENHSFEGSNIKGNVIKNNKGTFIVMSDKLNSQEAILKEINNFT